MAVTLYRATFGLQAACLRGSMAMLLLYVNPIFDSMHELNLLVRESHGVSVLQDTQLN